MPQCLVSFGSNLGTRLAVMASAARALALNPQVENLRVSRLYETPPIGGPSGQDPFLNGVAAFDTTARAREVLGWLQQLEQQLGRRRQQRWGARSIDLDIVLHGNLIGGASDLTVPHPRYTARRFVLQPACDVAADYRDPRFGWTLARLNRHLELGSPSLALAGADAATRAELCRRLRVDHQILTFDADPLPQPMAVIANVPAGIPVLPPESPLGPQLSPSLDSPLAAPPSRASTQDGLGDDAPWVAAAAGPLPPPEVGLPEGAAAGLAAAAGQAPRGQDESREYADRRVPRLIARMQWTRPQDRWPAPHMIWPATSRWPEYRLEVDDLDWAAKEVVSALASMRCPLRAITTDGRWWC